LALANRTPNATQGVENAARQLSNQQSNDWWKQSAKPAEKPAAGSTEAAPAAKAATPEPVKPAESAAKGKESTKK
jgi:hypothetical protein